MSPSNADSCLQDPIARNWLHAHEQPTNFYDEVSKVVTWRGPDDHRTTLQLMSLSFPAFKGQRLQTAAQTCMGAPAIVLSHVSEQVIGELQMSLNHLGTGLCGGQRDSDSRFAVSAARPLCQRTSKAALGGGVLCSALPQAFCTKSPSCRWRQVAPITKKTADDGVMATGQITKTYTQVSFRRAAAAASLCTPATLNARPRGD
jgi:hypothetical protein